MSPSRAVPSAVVAELHVVTPDATLVLAGDVDLHAAGQVVGALAAVAACPVLDLTVDLRRVEFMSLGLLGELASVGRVLTDRGGSLALVGTSPVQRRVLNLLDLAPGVVLADAVDG